MRKVESQEQISAAHGKGGLGGKGSKNKAEIKKAWDQPLNKYVCVCMCVCNACGAVCLCVVCM